MGQSSTKVTLLVMRRRRQKMRGGRRPNVSVPHKSPRLALLTSKPDGLLSLTKEEVEKVGYPEWSAHFPKSARPDEGYPVVVVGNHQLHCLHYIWQDHHLDYYKGRAAFKEQSPAMYEGHYEHCIDFLRQRLMCHYDMSVTPYQWVNGHQAPMPGAMTNEKCVDWEAMRTWMKDNIPETPDDFVWQIPDDAVQLEDDP